MTQYLIYSPYTLLLSIDPQELINTGSAKEKEGWRQVASQGDTDDHMHILDYYTVHQSSY